VPLRRDVNRDPAPPGLKAKVSRRLTERVGGPQLVSLT
jgi:hypothetical protein